MLKAIHKKLFTLTIVLLILTTPIPTLTVLKDRELVMLIPLLNRVEIDLEFIHSSELTLWRELWVANSDGILLTEVCWVSEGAGHPATFTDFGYRGRFIVKNDMYCYTDIDRALGRELVIDTRYGISMHISIAGKDLEDGVIELRIALTPLITYLINIPRLLSW